VRVVLAGRLLEEFLQANVFFDLVLRNGYRIGFSVRLASFYILFIFVSAAYVAGVAIVVLVADLKFGTNDLAIPFVDVIRRTGIGRAWKLLGSDEDG
jgi:hypothetical protein